MTRVEKRIEALLSSKENQAFDAALYLAGYVRSERRALEKLKEAAARRGFKLVDRLRACAEQEAKKMRHAAGIELGACLVRAAGLRRTAAALDVPETRRMLAKAIRAAAADAEADTFLAEWEATALEDSRKP